MKYLIALISLPGLILGMVVGYFCFRDKKDKRLDRFHTEQKIEHAKEAFSNSISKTTGSMKSKVILISSYIKNRAYKNSKGQLIDESQLAKYKARA
jgi:hypothetical protein